MATMEDNLTLEDNLMNGLKILALAAVAGICFAVTTPMIQAQVGIEIGVAPVCPYGYYDVPPYECAPYGTMARNGLQAASSLGPARGFTAQPISMAT